MRTTALITFGVAIALLLLFGCPKEQPPAPPQRPAAPVRLLKGLPVEMTLEQRIAVGAYIPEGG